MSQEPKQAHHPSADLLEAWADHQLEAAAAERLERHFESCSFCRELADDLRAFDQLGEAEAPAEAAKSLGELRRRILVAEAEESALAESRAAEGDAEASAILPFVAAISPGRSVPRPEGYSRFSFFSAWAAAAITAILGAYLVAGRQQEITLLNETVRMLDAARASLEAERRLPVANPAILELRPQSDPLRSGFDPTPQATGMAVVLRGDSPFPAGSWNARFKIGTRVLLEVPDLKPFAGTLRFILPPGALEPGDYQIHLTRGDGADWPEVFSISIGR